MTGPKPPEWFMNDGCTMAPDVWRGIDIRKACLYHDWHLTLDEIPRWKADGYFYLNLRELGMPRIPAFGYFVGVRLADSWIGRLFGWSRNR